MKSSEEKLEKEKSRKFEVIVLGGRRLREQDRIVFLLAREYGRLDAVAYGAKKEGGKWEGRLEPFARLHAHLYRGGASGLWTMREGRLIDQPASGDWRMGMAVQAAGELIVHATPAEGTEPQSFDLAADFGREVQFSPEPVTMMLAFVFAWFEACGFGRPESGSKRLTNFVARAASDPCARWKRYRLPNDLRPAALVLARDFAEQCIEKKWNGMDMLMKMLAK